MQERKKQNCNRKKNPLNTGGKDNGNWFQKPEAFAEAAQNTGKVCKLLVTVCTHMLNSYNDNDEKIAMISKAIPQT